MFKEIKTKALFKKKFKKIKLLELSTTPYHKAFMKYKNENL